VKKEVRIRTWHGPDHKKSHFMSACNDGFLELLLSQDLSQPSSNLGMRLSWSSNRFINYSYLLGCQVQNTAIFLMFYRHYMKLKNRNIENKLIDLRLFLKE